MVDDCELVGVKIQYEAVEGAFETKSLHTVTIMTHKEYSPYSYWRPGSAQHFLSGGNMVCKVFHINYAEIILSADSSL